MVNTHFSHAVQKRPIQEVILSRLIAMRSLYTTRQLEREVLGYKKKAISGTKEITQFFRRTAMVLMIQNTAGRIPKLPSFLSATNTVIHILHKHNEVFVPVANILQALPTKHDGTTRDILTLSRIRVPRGIFTFKTDIPEVKLPNFFNTHTINFFIF